MNTINLTGRMTDKAVIRTTSNDKKVANFTVAVKGYGDHTDFIRCTAFNGTAEYLEKYSEKGVKIAVTGSLHTDSYTKEDDTKVFTNEVYVSAVELTKASVPKAEVQDFVETDSEELPFN